LHIAPQHKHDRPHCRKAKASIHIDQSLKSNAQQKQSSTNVWLTAVHEEVEEMEHLLRRPPILRHPALDSDQLHLPEKSSTTNSEFWNFQGRLSQFLLQFPSSHEIARPQIITARVIERKTDRN
jgi:hypothetical protein